MEQKEAKEHFQGINRGPAEGVPDPAFLLVRRIVHYRWGVEELPQAVFLSRKEAEEHGDHEYGKDKYIPLPETPRSGLTWSVRILPTHGSLATLLKQAEGGHLSK